MKMSKSMQYLVLLLVLAGGGAGAWWYLMEEEQAAVPAGKVAAKKSAPRPGKAATTAEAKVLPTEPDAVIKAIIDGFGAPSYFADLSKQARQNVAAAGKGMPGADGKILESALERTFDPVKMTADLAAHLKQGYDAERMPRLVELLRQPVAVKMNAFETQQPTAAALQEYFEAQKKSPPSLERQRLVQQVDQASLASESAADLVVAMLGSLIQAAQEGSSQAAVKQSRQEIDQSLEPMRGQLSTQYRSLYHYVYRQAGDGDLGEYLKLLGSDLGKWGTLTLNSAMRSVVMGRSKELATVLAQLNAGKPVAESKEAAPPKAAAAEAKAAAPVKPAPEGTATAPSTEVSPAKPAPESKAVAMSGAAQQAAPEAKSKEEEDEESEEETKPAADGAKTKAKPSASAGRRAQRNAEVPFNDQAEIRHTGDERPPVRVSTAPPLYKGYNDLITATVMMDHDSMADLLDKGKNPNVRQRNGYTPLMIAATYGDVVGARLLLSKGADANMRLIGGETALSLARARGKGEVAALIESFASKQ